MFRRLVAQAGGAYTHLACDITQADDVAHSLRPFADRIDVLVHNAHTLLIKPFADTTAVEFEQAWRVACLGAMISAQAVIPHMAARGRGTVIFTGATAANSRRRKFFRLCFGKIRIARPGAIAGTRVRPEGRACRPCRARWPDRRRPDQATLWRSGVGTHVAASDRKDLSRSCRARAIGVEPRDGLAPVLGTLLTETCHARHERINADFTQRVVIATGDLPWIASPRPASSAACSTASAARSRAPPRWSAMPGGPHSPRTCMGSAKSFSCSTVSSPTNTATIRKGTYVRNPPGSRHTPRTAPGCTILVKLRQMTPAETARVVIDTTSASWVASDSPDLCRLPLYRASDSAERVAIERLARRQLHFRRGLSRRRGDFPVVRRRSGTNMAVTARAPGSGTRTDSGAACNHPMERNIG